LDLSSKRKRKNDKDESSQELGFLVLKKQGDIKIKEGEL